MELIKIKKNMGSKIIRLIKKNKKTKIILKVKKIKRINKFKG